MAKTDMLVRMKADTSGYDANIAKARKQLNQFKQDNLTLGGVISQSTKSIMAAAAQYASFAAVIGTVTSGIASAISEGTAMAREMEGVKMAFDRLNQPGLLDNLREATHGTVNDLELMKNAVKFENFGLSLEQMGTFLAFAQQQAKDTGQSVEYLVDSIVTGLGRKSLPILDNLGLSSTEIKKKMEETGDMTKAVAEIIKDRMEKAGGYIETAADRAAQSQVRLENAMMELGNTFQSLSGEASGLWTEIKIGAIDLLNSAIKPLISAFNALAEYANVPTAEDILTRGMDDVTGSVDDKGRLIRKNAVSSIPEITITGTKSKQKKSGSTKAQSLPSYGDFSKQLSKSILDTDALKSAGEQLSPYAMMLDEIKTKILDIQDADLGSALAIEGEKKIKKEIQDATDLIDQQRKAYNMAAIAAENFGSAMSGLDDPAARAAGTVMSAIANIALGFGQAVAQAGSMGPYAWLAYLAAGTAALATTISTVHNLTGYAQGGIVDGRSYSGDNIPILANAGEIVLSKSMQNNLANALQGNGLGNLNLTASISGEMIRLSLNHNGMRTGRGEYVTTKFQ